MKKFKLKLSRKFLLLRRKTIFLRVVMLNKSHHIVATLNREIIHHKSKLKKNS